MTQTSSRFEIRELDCPAEEQLIRGGLASISGLAAMRFNYLTRQVEIEHDETQSAEVESAIKGLGLTVRRLGSTRATPLPSGGCKDGECSPSEANPNDDHSVDDAPQSAWSIAATVLAGLLAISAEVWAWTTNAEHSPVVFGLALASVLLGGMATLRKAWMAVRSFTLNINFLMTVAVIGAFAIGEFPEAAMVIFLFGLAEMIESMALDRARRAVQSLLEMAPDTAAVLQPDNTWKDVPATQVTVGAVVRVRPGERVPLDGKVRSGESTINEAPITGESMPVAKSPGDQVFAGTINGEGSLEFTTTGGVDDTTLARIVRTVQEAQSERAPTQRFVDQFALVYTPTVCVIAIALALVPWLVFQQPWDVWVYRALVLLVVACPCALVISTPVTVVSGLAAAAQRGILIKGGVYLERGYELKVIALDKTGTITEGKPKVTDVLPLQGTRDELLRIAASLDAQSQHPIARAITEAWQGDLASVSDFQSLTGRGVEGIVDGQKMTLGNHRLAEERKVCSPETEAKLNELESQGKTAIILADDTRVIGVIGVADRPRETSIDAIRQLHERGVRLVMLSGDNSRTADAIAKEVGLDEARGDLLPETKLEIIDQLLAEHGEAAVGMVGDGVNDAPALAKSSIGFAMGAAGTDTAIETADVALMNDDLRGVPDFIALSELTSRILLQNICIALGAKGAFLILTLFGLATLWLAVIADVGASLVVIANGLRLLAGPASVQPESRKKKEGR